MINLRKTILFMLFSINLIASEGEVMKIDVISNGNKTTFELNNSNAAKELFSQLPLNIKVEDYASNEKIFYPPKKLNTLHTPLANSKNGTLAYYAPWGDVVMFYRNFTEASGLYELGRCIKGCEHIINMSGKIEIK